MHSPSTFTAIQFMKHLLLPLLAVALFCSGCGRRQNDTPPPPTFSVTGEVRSENGQPAGKVLVQFVSERNPSLNMSGVTADDGTFTLKTSHGNQSLSGGIEGPCRVMLTPPFSAVPKTIQLPDVYHVKAEANRFVLKLPQVSAK